MCILAQKVLKKGCGKKKGGVENELGPNNRGYQREC